MSCSCTNVCEIPTCVETINMGIIDPDITVLVQFKEIVTGRIKQVQGESDETGELIIDVSNINSFFSPNFVYEVTILASNANQCDTEDWTIDDTADVECVQIRFIQIEVEEPVNAELQIA